MKKANWIKNPSKKNLILFTILWVLGITLLILSMSNFLTENIIQKRYVTLYFLIIVSSLTVFKLHINFWKNHNSRKITN